MTADSAYIDTSVLGACYCPEPVSMAAENAARFLVEIDRFYGYVHT